MSGIEALKERARRHEQREEWTEALELYRKAIKRQDQDDQPDIGLYNRIGDLQTRLGNLEAAADAYERTVDLYLESELANNAIAVCKKMIRHLPGRPEVFLRMGQIRAGQGFLVDARQSFLTYAERMQSLGDIDEAFRALIEFADLAPEDAEIRLAVAAQMQQHERSEEALEQLAIGYGLLVARGREEEAVVFEERIREVDPDADVEELMAGTPAMVGVRERSGLAEVGDGLADIQLGGPSEPHTLPAEGPREPAHDEVSPEELGFTLETGEEDAGEGRETTLEGFQPTSLGGLPQGEPEESEEAASAMERGSGGPEPLPLLDDTEPGTEGIDDRDAAEVGGPPGRRDEAEEEGAPDLPLLDEPEAEPSEEAARGGGVAGRGEPEGADEATDVDAVLDLQDAVREAAEEAAEEAAAAARAEEAREVDPVEQVERLASAGDVAGAMDVARDLIEESPDEVSHRQRLVELAFRSGADDPMVEAYLGLAGALDRSGEADRARAVFRQVLSLDPENETARAALAGEAGGAGDAEGSREVASSEDYVDLGALILDEEEDEKTTRFVVAYEEPSGDEAADFAKMLNQFKKKVAQNVSADDVKAHHDLGTAYKEMGLYDEAIQEYQQALRASGAHLPTYELLGQCFMEKGEHEAAIRSLSRALEAPQAVEDELIGIYYYLGRAHEQVGNTRSAVDFYDRVFALDINFADVTERLRALR